METQPDGDPTKLRKPRISQTRLGRTKRPSDRTSKGRGCPAGTSWPISGNRGVDDILEIFFYGDNGSENKSNDGSNPFKSNQTKYQIKSKSNRESSLTPIKGIPPNPTFIREKFAHN